ncbi:MAG: HAD family hydrolase [Alphaproteobacteria bacterium]|nr:HAD family hydrolase [Alphaproteobacteria bacterium]
MTDRKLAVFDWNGTLIADTIPAWHASNKCLAFYGQAPISLARQRETFDFPILHYYKRNGCPIDKVLETKGEANEIFQSHYERLAAGVRTRRGARALLDWLSEQGVDCIILSNYLTHKITPHLERLKLGHYFSFISANNCDGTTILSATNKLERLSDFMLTRGYHPGNAFIIGDSREEPDIARHLGLISIGITGGCISESRLRAAKPDHVVGSLRDVPGVLARVWA